jgi:uncharacterized membrane protein YeaQ/YmgE (transglycosylase-associated protein family)
LPEATSVVGIVAGWLAERIAGPSTGLLINNFVGAR